MTKERRLVLVPADDAAFAAAVEDAFVALDTGSLTDDELAAAVKAALMARFPGVHLRSRDAIADNAPNAVTWYVLRDASADREHGEPDVH
jgi:hypothetical protein